MSGLSLLFKSRCWKNHTGPEGVWRSVVIRSGIGRFLYWGGQGWGSPSGLWCRHSNRRKGPPLQNQVVYLSKSNQRLFFLVSRAAFNCFLFFFWTSRNSSGPSHGGRECTVGQYVVDVPSFESLALPLFRNVRCWCMLFEHINRSEFANSSPSTLSTNRQSLWFLQNWWNNCKLKNT